MLDPPAADLVDTVARLCVLRTEDYVLLQTVYSRVREHEYCPQQQEAAPHVLHSAPKPAGNTSGAKENKSATSKADDKTYIRYLTDEVRVREERRMTEEGEWLEAVRQWAALFQSRSVAANPNKALRTAPDESISLAVPAIWSFWEQESESAFQCVYAAVLQQAYELDPTDLVNTPFAQLDKSKCLYDCEAAAAVASVPVSSSQVKFVHALLFLSSQTAEPSCSPSRVLAEMHPIEADDASAVNERRRSRLRASHHAWLVLFLLWCHIVASSIATSAGAAAAACGVRVEPLFYESVLLSPARDFLTSQSLQLQSLLRKIQGTTFV
ncbi:hypothetical protein NXY56_007233 [Leishmania guyanensis]|uniref:Uncharacterized protein n=1 Tax=Leishmania guyanensis TaxID=5670 RepID=A0A1E1J7X8_LEIGU|nr:hypothetical protein, unknown function [Leishmania guyanensis]